MKKAREGFYNDNAQLTTRGIEILEKLTPMLRRMFQQAKTPRECMELHRAIDGDVSISCSIRILSLYGKKKVSRP